MAHKNFYDFACSEKEELDEKAKKGDVSLSDVQYADMLEHYLKSANTNKAMKEAENGGYSGGYMPMRGMYYDTRNGMSYADGSGGDMSGNRGGSSNRGGNSYEGSSYARGRRNARRDSMGRYSGNGGYSYAAEMDGIMDDLRDLMADMPADKQRRVSELMEELRR